MSVTSRLSEFLRCQFPVNLLTIVLNNESEKLESLVLGHLFKIGQELNYVTTAGHLLHVLNTNSFAFEKLTSQYWTL